MGFISFAKAVGLLSLLTLSVEGMRHQSPSASHGRAPRLTASRGRAVAPPMQRTGRVRSEATGQGFGEESVVAALEAMKRGEMVLVTDDEDRENEGDLILAAEFANEDNMAFMIRQTSGVICVSLDDERVDELRLPPMVGRNEDPKGTAFTVSVDASRGTSTGISAGDRAQTLRLLADENSGPEDFLRPGHVFPLRAKKHGVLARQGHTEAALDLCRLAGLKPAGVLCEVISEDGKEMARMPELMRLAEQHGLVLTSIADLVRGQQHLLLQGSSSAGQPACRARRLHIASATTPSLSVWALPRRCPRAMESSRRTHSGRSPTVSSTSPFARVVPGTARHRYS